VGLRYIELGGSWSKVKIFDQESVELLLNILRDGLENAAFVYGRKDTTANIIHALSRAYPQIDDGRRNRIYDAIWGCLESEDSYIVEAATSFLVEHAIEKGLDELYPILLQDHFNTQKAIIAMFGKHQDKKATDMLLEAFGKVQPMTADLISKKLAESGDPRVFEPILAFLFSQNGYDERSFFIGAGYEALFKDYYNIIFALLYGLSRTTTETGGEYTNYFYEYDSGRIRETIKDLCALKTPVSVNLLHLASKLGDIEVTTAWGWNISNAVKGTVSMEDVRATAKAELNIRGNPPYDEAHYIAKGAWKM